MRLRYSGCVVGEGPQVPQVGVDESPGALDVQADVVVGGVRDEHSQAGRQQRHARSHTHTTHTVTGFRQQRAVQLQ